MRRSGGQPGPPGDDPRDMSRLRDPIKLFRFALAERDWALAALLAGSMDHSVAIRPQLEHEVKASAAVHPDGPGSLGALRTLATLIRILRAS
jgi:hypothetical protein